MRSADFSGSIQSLEWMRAPDCATAPYSPFLAPPDRRMDTLWTGNSRVLHPISSHAGTGGLPGRSSLFNFYGQLRSVCLLSFSLAPLYRVSFCPSSISRILIHSGCSLHCCLGSDCAPLG